METRGEGRKQKSVKGKKKETGGENKGGEESKHTGSDTGKQGNMGGNRRGGNRRGGNRRQKQWGREGNEEKRGKEGRKKMMGGH